MTNFTRIGVVSSLAALLCSGCAISEPQTLAEKAQQQEPNFGYTPIDPLPISGLSHDDILSLLPDTTMRLAIGSFDSSGNITYGPAKLVVAGNHYQVILDYIQYTTLPIPVSIKVVPLTADEIKAGRKSHLVVNILPEGQAASADKIIPVYVGVGLRLTANITALKNNVDLSNLVAIGAAASSNQIYGTLTVQAMGISGQTVSETLPMPSTLDQSTVQNAMMALGNIKAKQYGKNNILITPQVVAVYNSFASSDARLVSGLVELILLDQPSLSLEERFARQAQPTTRASN